MDPSTGCSISTTAPSAATWSEANAAPRSLIGPAGTSAAPRRSSHVTLGAVANRAAMSGRSVSRLATRAPFVTNRGSSVRSGAPIAQQKRSHWRSLPTATAINPSTVANVSYGTMFGWAFPRRVGEAPETK